MDMKSEQQAQIEKLPTISEAESEVMKIIWFHAPISTNEVVEELLKTSTWTAKTIQSLLGRLVKKGVLEYKKNGRVFVYTPLIRQEEYLEEESRNFLNRFYDGTLKSMVVNFLEKDKLTKSDIDELRSLLDERASKGGK